MTFEEYEEKEQRRRRAHARIIWSAVAVATVGLPVAYLLLIGQFSMANLIPQKKAVLVHNSRPARTIYNPLSEAKRTPAEQARFDRLKSDVHDYVTRDLAALALQEKIAVIGFSGVTGANFRDSATTMHALRTDVIPAQQKMVSEAAALRPKTPEVSSVNQQLLLSAKMRLLAYRLMLSGASDPDALWTYAFDADFKDADEKARTFREHLTDLTNETGVNPPQ